MKKRIISIVTAAACSSVFATALAGCGGDTAEKKETTVTTVTTAEATSSSQESQSSATEAARADSSSALLVVDGVEIKEVGVDMVGSTPNLSVVFANTNDHDVEFDCSKFVVKIDDAKEIDFAGSMKTFPANESYIQWAFTAKPDSTKVGDSVTIYYGDQKLGTYEVTEF